MIADTTRIERTDDLLEAEVNGELVGLRVANDSCYGFNPTATRIWALLARPTDVGALVAALTAEFDVSEDECRADVAALLADLANDGLVKLTPATA